MNKTAFQEQKRKQNEFFISNIIRKKNLIDYKEITISLNTIKKYLKLDEGAYS